MPTGADWVSLAVAVLALIVGTRALRRIRRHEDLDSWWERAKRLRR